LEKLKKSIEETVSAKQAEIDEVSKNIEMLMNSKKALLSKQMFLENNMKVK